MVICTFNPDPTTLKQVIAGLREQKYPLAEWEIVVVDNGSKPAVERYLDLGWHPHWRVVIEPNRGLTHARLRGFLESRGDFIVFVDDDVVLEKAYLKKADEIMATHPFIGVLGGRGVGVFEEEPEIWTREFLWILCAHNYDQSPRPPLQYALTYQLGPWAPPGAGMVVRKDVAQEYAHELEKMPVRKRLDRLGRFSVLGGGDTDIIFTSIDHGWACAVSNDLKFKHIIPKERLKLDYLRRLLYASNYITAQLLLLHGWRTPIKLSRRSTIRNLVRTFMKRLWWHSPEQECWEAFSQGYRDGLANRLSDRRYCQTDMFPIKTKEH